MNKGGVNGRWFWVIGIAVLIAGLAFASGSLRSLFAEAAGRVTLLSVVATVPGQIAASLLCAAALHALKPGVSFFASLVSRLLRDAGDNLLVFLPGLGEVIGARALVLSGGQTRAAITASALDKFAETVAQVPYIMLAVWVLWQGWRSEADWSGYGWLAGAALVLALMFWVIWRMWLRNTTLAHRLRLEWRKLVDEAKLRKAGLPMSTFLHFLAWIMGSVQLWMAAQALDIPLGVFEAVALESAAYAGRAVLFFIPAGLVTQEAGLIAAGLVFGISPAQSLALGLILRLRDVVFGLPLLAWPWVEFRRARAGRIGG